MWLLCFCMMLSFDRSGFLRGLFRFRAPTHGFLLLFLSMVTATATAALAAVFVLSFVFTAFMLASTSAATPTTTAILLGFLALLLWRLASAWALTNGRESRTQESMSNLFFFLSLLRLRLAGIFSAPTGQMRRATVAGWGQIFPCCLSISSSNGGRVGGQIFPRCLSIYSSSPLAPPLLHFRAFRVQPQQHSRV